MTFGDRYAFRVRGADVAGNTSDWAYGQPFLVRLVDLAQTRHVRLVGSWSDVPAGGAINGRVAQTSQPGAEAQIVGVPFCGVGWVTETAPIYGQAEVRVNGVSDQEVSFAGASEELQLRYGEVLPPNTSLTITDISGTIALDAVILLQSQ